MSAEKLNINQWAKEDRPREKLLAQGAAALSDAELLAILIGSGTTEESAVGLMRRIMNDCNNNLNTLGKKSAADLMKYKGIGEAKAISIIAACELGRRRAKTKAEERRSLRNPADIYAYLHPQMQDLDVEEAWVLYMNQNHKLIKAERISHGGISETAVDVRIIIRDALQNNATVLALAHNHPSNNANPSADDNRLTEKVSQACHIMRIYFLDHLIITDGAYYSYREHGRL